MAEHFDVEPLDASFGARVTGLKLTDMSDAAFDELYETWLEHGLLLFPDQHMAPEAQVDVARRFGPLEVKLFAISNVREDGSVRTSDEDDLVKILKGNMGWHHDSTYMPLQAKGAVFSAHVVPSEGGETGFADMRQAHDALDDDVKTRLAGLTALHSLHYSQMKAGYRRKEKDSEYIGYGLDERSPVRRQMVKVHPETGRKSLLVGRHAFGVSGMSEKESEDFVDGLNEFAGSGDWTYHHKWTPGEVVLWDNRCLMHRACPWDMTKPRVMYHSRIAGDPESEAGVAA